MKKIVMLSVLLSVVLMCGAQKREVTKFMGIPIDGSYESFEKRLLKKGFTLMDQSYVPKKFYRGMFNGSPVRVQIITSGDKVYRVQISDEELCSEEEIKERFNKLCWQFCESKKYLSFYGSYDSICIRKDRVYTDLEKEVNFPLFFQGKESDLDEEFFQAHAFEYNGEHVKIKITGKDDPVNLEALFETYKLKCVFFMIVKFMDKYYITMFYDNGYNYSKDGDI